MQPVSQSVPQKLQTIYNMYIDVSSVIASHTLRYMQTMYNIYNTINHTVKFTVQLNDLHACTDQTSPAKVTNNLQYVHRRQFSYGITYVKIHANYVQYLQHD